MTSAQEKPVTASWSEIAKEPVKIEIICSIIYAFGSEVACLRLFYAFRFSPDKPTVGYSENLGTWYFEKILNV